MGASPGRMGAEELVQPAPRERCRQAWPAIGVEQNNTGVDGLQALLEHRHLVMHGRGYDRVLVTLVEVRPEHVQEQTVTLAEVSSAASIQKNRGDQAGWPREPLGDSELDATLAEELVVEPGVVERPARQEVRVLHRRSLASAVGAEQSGLMNMPSVYAGVLLIEGSGHVGAAAAFLRAEVVLTVDHHVARDDGREQGEESLLERGELVQLVKIAQKARRRE